MACVIAVFFAATVLSVNLVLRSFVPVAETSSSGSGIGCSEATSYILDNDKCLD